MSINFCIKCGKAKNPDDRLYGKECEANFKETGFSDKVMKSKKMQSAIANAKLDTDVFNQFISHKLTTGENAAIAIQNKVKEIFDEKRMDVLIDELSDLRSTLQENNIYLSEYIGNVDLNDDKVLIAYLTAIDSDTYLSDDLYYAFDFTKDNYITALVYCPHGSAVYDDFMDKLEDPERSTPEELNAILTAIDHDNTQNDFLYEFRKGSTMEFVLKNPNCPDWLVDRYLDKWSIGKTTIDLSSIVENRNFTQKQIITIAKGATSHFSYMDISHIKDPEFYKELYEVDPTYAFQETHQMPKELQREFALDIADRFKDSDDYDYIVCEIAPNVDDSVALYTLYKNSNDEYTRDIIKSNQHWQDDASIVKSVLDDILKDFEKVD